MFDGLLKSKFFTKCKSDIKLTRTRIEIIKKKRNATQKYLRKDVADLLKNGFDSNAFDRAEGLLADMIKSECYELIDQYCEHISKNLSAMNKERECPEDCREAAASLMFAAARFADLPELRELRTMFSERYGKSLDYYVNKQFSEKLKADPPSKDMKLQLLHEIAAESGLEWDAKALENKLFNASAYDKHHIDGSAQKGTTGYEYGRAREITPERKNDLPKETTRNGLSPPVKVKDIQMDTFRKTLKPNEAAPVRKVPKEDDEVEPLKQMPIPPYTKPVASKATSSSSDESDSSNDKVEPADAKPKGKSVRTKLTKPSLDQDIAGGGEKETVKGINKENVAQGRRILKFFDGVRGGGGGQRDEEEKMMDKLLRHYSRRKSSNKNGKSEPEMKMPPKPHHAPTDSPKVKNLWSQDGPPRASSLRVEPTSTTDSPRKHSRATSFHPDLLNANAHVHPKLPDYDEFVARLAAFRGK